MTLRARGIVRNRYILNSFGCSQMRSQDYRPGSSWRWYRANKRQYCGRGRRRKEHQDPDLWRSQDNSSWRLRWGWDAHQACRRKEGVCMVLSHHNHHLRSCANPSWCIIIRIFAWIPHGIPHCRYGLTFVIRLLTNYWLEPDRFGRSLPAFAASFSLSGKAVKLWGTLCEA